MNSESVYSIGETASICGISAKTLRYYEQLGLVRPSERNPETGYRYYKKEQLIQIQSIKLLKHLQFSLEEIREILLIGDISVLEEKLKGGLLKLDSQIRLLQSQRDEAEIFLYRIQQSSKTLQDFSSTLPLKDFSQQILSIEDIPERNVVSIRRLMTSYIDEEIQIERWVELMRLVRKEGAYPIGPITVAYHNNPLEHFYSPSCDYEIYVEVGGNLSSKEVKHIKGFCAAVTMHVGNYRNLSAPTILALHWACQQGYRIAGHIENAFLISPLDTSVEHNLLTKIIIPIEKE